MTNALTEEELRKIAEHMHDYAMTLAIIRTEHAPSELTHLLDAAGLRLGARLSRMYSSPMSDFCMAEMDSGSRVLVMLFVQGSRTELLSVSETDQSAIRELEDSIHYSNFHSEIMRHGL